MGMIKETMIEAISAEESIYQNVLFVALATSNKDEFLVEIGQEELNNIMMGISDYIKEDFPTHKAAIRYWASKDESKSTIPFAMFTKCDTNRKDWKKILRKYNEKAMLIESDQLSHNYLAKFCSLPMEQAIEDYECLLAFTELTFPIVEIEELSEVA